ncbi:MAG TPA: phosphatase PAP2 family protein [Rhodopila sp.]|nr:phosphatase PAP2 family protein [Rhodopila sp.]
MVNSLSRFDLFKGVIVLSLFWWAWAAGKPNETPREQDERHDRLVNVLIGSLLIGTLSRCLQVVLHIHQRPLLSGLPLHFPVLETGFDSLNPWNSFPSDHSMLFFALSTGLWTINRRVGIIAMLWSLLVIDPPRIYLAIHYPSDVIGGAVLGTFCMLGFQRLPLVRIGQFLSDWRHRYRGAFMAAVFLLADEVAHLFGDVRDLLHSTVTVLFHGHQPF